MDPKTCLVTGANSGIGKETARGLADAGHEVLMFCRSEERGQAALDEIQADTGSEDLELVLCDLANQAEIEQAAYEVTHRAGDLDVLVNNAGAVLDDRELTEDGYEKQFAVNHLGPFLLTHELLDTLQAAGQEDPASRVVNVASEAHRNAGDLPEGFQNLEGSYSGFKVYSQTKLYNIHFTKSLARRLDPETVTVNCLHPGVVGSNFGASGPWYVRWFMKIARPFLTDPADAASTSLYLATSPEVEAETGGYYIDQVPATPSSQARDDELQEELWQVSEKLTGASDWPKPRQTVPR